MNKAIARPGELRQECHFLSPLEGRDDNGAPIKTWVASQLLYAKLDYQITGSGEDVTGGRLHAQTRVLVTIRHVSAINETFRMYFDGYEWNIKAIQLFQPRDYMTLEVEQDRPSTLIEWTTPDGETWQDPDGNDWIFYDPTQTLANATGISWTNPSGNILTPAETIN